MRIGEKCKFVLGENMYALKAGRKYTGIYAGGDRVRYQRFIVVPEEIIPIKKVAVKKEKAPTTSDYKNFSDLCFEVAIRYRDNWTSIVSGKKFEEGDWNGLQAGHGVSRQYWGTRHNPLNCHAITSGENYAMSLGNAQTIMRYWNYVAKIYGQEVVDTLINIEHKPIKLSVAVLQQECKLTYDFLTVSLLQWLVSKNKITKVGEMPDTDYYIKWRCEKLPKKKADGIMKVLKIVKGE